LFVTECCRILAHQNLKQHLDTKGAPQTKTYDHDFTIKLGGIEAQLFHFGNAHTNGDTVVYFPNLKVVAVGDLFAATPDPDFAAGGSLVGWGPVLEQILNLDFDTVVPSNGPMLTRAELEAFQKKMDTLASRASALAKKGVAKNQLMAQLKTDDLGWQFHFSPVQIDHFYAELMRAK
jgi:cyclase